MPYSPHLARVCVDPARIRANYRLLEGLVKARSAPGTPAVPCKAQAGAERLPSVWPVLMPVVKADAYGHGHIPVARALLEEGATWFASGCVREAVLLRKGLAGQNGATEPVGIVSLLGLAEPGDARLCAANSIIPLLHSMDQLRLLADAEPPAEPDVPLPVALKCNTGMSRLGFNEKELPLLRERLGQLPVLPVLAVSHLHSADMEDGREQARRQARVFARFLAALREQWPGMAASLGNSAGALLTEEITPLIGPHICRPGLALYGCNPFHGTPLAALGQGFAPAMSVYAPVIATRRLAAGDSIGYGHDFIAAREIPVGIVGVGYADCYARSLSGRGTMCVAGVRAPVIGRMSMQMTAVDLSLLYADNTEARPRTAWLLGGPYAGGVSPEELAALWGTIPYEVFCLLGRNEKLYGPYPGGKPDQGLSCGVC